MFRRRLLRYPCSLSDQQRSNRTRSKRKHGTPSHPFALIHYLLLLLTESKLTLPQILLRPKDDPPKARSEGQRPLISRDRHHRLMSQISSDSHDSRDR
jgi:hypothetical protein